MDLLEDALRVDGADEVQATLAAWSGGLTRFADSAIHQHTERADAEVHVRVVDGKRTATVSTNRLDQESLREAGRRALEVARLSPPDELFPGLPADSGAPLPVPERVDAETAEATPASRAARVAEAVREAGHRPAAGFYSTDLALVAIANTSGIRRLRRATFASFTCMVRSEDGSAHEDRAAWRAADIDPAGIAADLAGWADRARGADHEAGTGEWAVVLMPLAVAEMVEYLSYIGFGGKEVLTGESFLAERAGTRVASDLVTIADDVSHPANLGLPFDGEGVWRQRVAVVEEGLARGPVWDTRTAAEAGTRTTGHATGSQEWGPMAMNVVVEPGDSSVDDLVGRVERGLLVRRFWYVNVVGQRETVLTGMTRDGLFLIEEGKVKRPVHNLRFTQNVLDALEGCTGVGRDVVTVAPGWGVGASFSAPALALSSFRFTSGTTH